MAGYSGTPLVSKLGIDGQARLVVLGAPWDYAKGVGVPASGPAVTTRLSRHEEFIHLFAVRTVDLSVFERIARVLIDDGMVWVSWPKRSSGIPTELTEEVIRQYGLKVGLVDVKVCAVNDVWSGLKFVRRLRDRAAGR